MKKLKRILIGFGIFISVIYLGICVLLYFYQEKLIFHPHPLAANYKFNYPGTYNELNIPTFDGKILNGVLFKTDSSKGLVFYLHGNAGALDTWGDVATTYNKLGYDIFIMDYRGFGKSTGEIYSQHQFYKDTQTAYDTMKHYYPENKIVLEGYSIGTGSAAMLAANNHPKLLILQAPYYSLTDLGDHLYPPVTPHFIGKYKFETYKYLDSTKVPVVIFHGTADKTIYYGSSLKLKEHFKQGDTLFTLPGAGHGGMNENLDYQRELKNILQ